jgi:hypothetical protein
MTIHYTTEEFIQKAQKIHGDKYNYSLVDYKKYNIKIKIICQIHGVFEQNPACHIQGQGCPICHGCKKSNNEQFIQKANKVHNNRYDYSKVNYVRSNYKIKIICPVHGEFEQIAANHLRYGCHLCYKSYNSNIKEFIDKIEKIHGDKYDYSKADYKNSFTKIKIICPVHGEFEQTPNRHLSGQCGCPKCPSVISYAQQELIDFIKEDKTINDREVIKPNELDIFIPSKNIAIEYHGIYWHSYNKLESNIEKYKHHNKASICFDKGIQLIQIFENEWLNKKNIVKSIINAKLGINNKIFARKCEIKELSSKEFNEFCNKSHIQGKLNSVIKLGLIHYDRLVCVIGFNRHSRYDYECTRFCNELNVNVVGGASKLFKYFLNKWKPNSILSFADRRYSNGRLYKTLGFELIGVTDPGYFYFKNGGDMILYSRQQFQKHKLKNKLDNFNSDLSEAQNMFNNKYRRLWDAGHWKFVWSNIK